ncbi:MAG: hypothetical protein ACP5OR_03175 [Candidatus Dormibacteria bacterium]
MSVAVAIWCAGFAAVLAGIGWVEVTRHSERQGVALAVIGLGGLIALLAAGVAFQHHEVQLFSFTSLGAMAVVCSTGMGIASTRVALRRLWSAGMLHEDHQNDVNHQEESE